MTPQDQTETETKPCHWCGGKGWNWSPTTATVRRHSAGMVGWVEDKPCRQCNGTGTITAEQDTWTDWPQSNG